MKKYKMTLTFDRIKTARDVYCRYMDCQCDICPINGICDPTQIDANAATIVQASKLMGLELIETGPGLTEPELTICKAVGAKWATRDYSSDDPPVVLWANEPQRAIKIYMGCDYIASVRPNLFPSLKPGDCVNVEEAYGDDTV